MKFTTTIVLHGNNTGIEIPPAVLAALGGGKRPAVVLTVGTLTYRSTIGSMGGKSLVPLSAARRAEAGVAGGETTEVEIALDLAPRQVELPAELAAALETEPQAKAFFETLSYSNQLKHALAVGDARTDETRQRRLMSVMDQLRAGKK